MTTKQCGAIGIALFFGSNMVGCTNATPAADVNQIADGMRSSLPVVSNDIAATCKRQNRIMVDTPSAEKSTTDKPQNCSSSVALAAWVKQDQRVLINYLDALGKLSGEYPAAYDAKIPANATALAAYTGLPSNVITASTAAQQILDSLADYATRRYRTEHVERLILAADPAIQQLTTALRQIIISDYKILLANEETSLASYYEGPMAAQKGERLALILVQRQYDADRATLAHRQSLADAYGNVMTSIATAHAKLAADARNRMSRKQMAADIRPFVTMLKNDVASLTAAERSGG